MAKQEKDILYVVAAAYDDVDTAVSDYEAIKALYQEVKTSHDSMRRPVQGRGREGEHRQEARAAHPPRRRRRPRLGLAVGVTKPCSRRWASGWRRPERAAPPSVRVAGHASGGMSRGDLKELGETLDAGQAGLVGLRDEPGRPDRRQHQGGQPSGLQGHRHGG